MSIHRKDHSSSVPEVPSSGEPEPTEPIIRQAISPIKDTIRSSEYVSTQTPSVLPYPILPAPGAGGSTDSLTKTMQVISSLSKTASSAEMASDKAHSVSAAPIKSQPKVGLETDTFVASDLPKTASHLIFSGTTGATGDDQINALAALTSVTSKIQVEKQVLTQAANTFTNNLTKASLDQLQLWITYADQLSDYAEQIAELSEQIQAYEKDIAAKQGDVAAKTADLANLREEYSKFLDFAVRAQEGLEFPVGTLRTADGKVFPPDGYSISTVTKFIGWFQYEEATGVDMTKLGYQTYINQMTQWHAISNHMMTFVNQWNSDTTGINSDNLNVTEDQFEISNQLPAQMSALQIKMDSVKSLLKNSLGLPPDYPDDLLQQIVDTLEACKKQISAILLALEESSLGNALAIFITVKNLISTANTKFQQSIGSQNYQDSMQNVVQLNKMGEISNLITQNLEDMMQMQAKINTENDAISSMQYVLYGLTAASLVASIGGAALSADPLTAIAGIFLEFVSIGLDIAAAAIGVAIAGVEIAVGVQQMKISQDQQDIAHAKYDLSRAQVYSQELQSAMDTITRNLIGFMKKLQEELKETSDMQSSAQAAVSLLKPS